MFANIYTTKYHNWDFIEPTLDNTELNIAILIASKLSKAPCLRYCGIKHVGQIYLEIAEISVAIIFIFMYKRTV